MQRQRVLLFSWSHLLDWKLIQIERRVLFNKILAGIFLENFYFVIANHESLACFSAVAIGELAIVGSVIQGNTCYNQTIFFCIIDAGSPFRRVYLFFKNDIPIVYFYYEFIVCLAICFVVYNADFSRLAHKLCRLINCEAISIRS